MTQPFYFSSSNNNLDSNPYLANSYYHSILHSNTSCRQRLLRGYLIVKIYAMKLLFFVIMHFQSPLHEKFDFQYLHHFPTLFGNNALRLYILLVYFQIFYALSCPALVIQQLNNLNDNQAIPKSTTT